MQLIKELVIRSTYEELEKAEGFLNDLQAKLNFSDEFYARLMLTVSEGITNGAVHGNELDENKKVTTRAFLDGNTLIIEVSDEGEGFNPGDVPDPLAAENLLKTSGRGVFLMEEYADKAEYLDEGNRLRLCFDLPDQK